MVKLFISIPTMRGLSSNTYVSLTKALDYLKNKVDGLVYNVSILPDESLISRARNSEFSQFLREDYEYFLSIDDDLGFPEDSFYKLIMSDKDMIAAAYPTRNLPIHHVVRAKINNNDLIVKDNLVALEYASTGFLLIKKRVGEKMKEMFTELKYNNNVDKEMMGTEEWAFFQPLIVPQVNHPHLQEYLSEDWSFCHRVKQAGFEIWLDPSIKMSHTGTYCFEGYSGDKLIDHVKDNYLQSK